MLYVRGMWSHNGSFLERLKFNIELELANAKWLWGLLSLLMLDE